MLRKRSQFEGDAAATYADKNKVNMKFTARTMYPYEKEHVYSSGGS